MTLIPSTNPNVHWVEHRGKRIGYILRKTKSWQAHRRFPDARDTRLASHGYRSEQSAIDWIVKSNLRVYCRRCEVAYDREQSGNACPECRGRLSYGPIEVSS